jgi:hypothetical protein
MKKLLAIETARAAVVTQWTKKVIVEKQNLANGQNTQEPLVSYISSSHCACLSKLDSFVLFIVIERCTVRTFQEMVCWRWLLRRNYGAADILLCTYMNLQPGTSVSPLASSLPKSRPLSIPELKLIIWWTRFKNFISVTEEFQPHSQ